MGKPVKKSLTSIVVIALLLLSLVVLVNSQKKTEYGKLYGDNGLLYYEGELKDGVPNGRGTAYDDKGVILYEGNFINGEIDQNGYAKTYWSNGQLLFEGILKDGKRVEGDVYDKDGNYSGYLPYAPITIIGEWVAGDLLDGNKAFADVIFGEDEQIRAPNNKVIGSYTLKMDGRNAQITIKLKKGKPVTGQLMFYTQTKNMFTLAANGTTVMFVRKGTDGYN